MDLAVGAPSPGGVDATTEENATGAAVERRISGRTLALVQGDITRVESDAVVNAANSALAGGGGVDGAIHRAGGGEIMAELRSRYPDGCPTGSAVMTTAGSLPARNVIHAVGPRWRGGGHRERGQLESAYRASLRLADEAGARTVTLPAISCGIYGYPLEEGARVALETVADALKSASSVERATFVLFSDETFNAFHAALVALETTAEG